MIKKTIIVSIIFGGALTITNVAHADQIQPFMDCTKITEDAKRLACFDVATKKLIDSGVATTVVEREVQSKEKQIANFGKRQLRESPVKKIREKQKKQEEKILKTVKLTVVDIAYTTTKKFVLFMENGQIWKQKEEGRIRLPKGKFEVEIKKGMVGGYNMIVPTKRTLIRVKRLK